MSTHNRTPQQIAQEVVASQNAAADDRAAQKRSLVYRINRRIAEAKLAYEKADKLFQKLCKLSPAGEIIVTKSGPFRIVDNFDGKTVVWKPARVARFELQAVKPPKALNPAKAAKPASKRPAKPAQHARKPAAAAA